MAIGGYTTAILSHDQHWNLIATLPRRSASSFACGVLVGIPALRLSGVYLALATFALAVSVPQLPLKFSKLTGGSNGAPHATTPSRTLALRGQLGVRGDRVRGSPGSSCAAGSAARSARSATARSPPPRPASRCRSTRRSPSASRPPSRASRARSSSSRRTASPSRRVRRPPLAQDPDRRRRRRARLALGRAVGALFVGLLPQISASVPLIGPAHGQDVVFGLIVILVMFLLPNGFAGLLRPALPRSKPLSNRIRTRHNRQPPLRLNRASTMRRRVGWEGRPGSWRSLAGARGRRGSRSQPRSARTGRRPGVTATQDHDRRHVPAHRARVALQDDPGSREGVLRVRQRQRRRQRTEDQLQILDDAYDPSKTVPLSSSSSSRTRSSRSSAASAPRPASRPGTT